MTVSQQWTITKFKCKYCHDNGLECKMPADGGPCQNCVINNPTNNPCTGGGRVPGYHNDLRQAILIGRTRKAFYEWRVDGEMPSPIDAHPPRLLKPYGGSEKRAVEALQNETYLSPRPQDGQEALKWTRFPRRVNRELPPFYLDNHSEAKKRRDARSKGMTHPRLVIAGSSSSQGSGQAQVTASSSSQTQPSFGGWPTSSNISNFAPLPSSAFAAAPYRQQGSQSTPFDNAPSSLYSSAVRGAKARSPSPTFAAARWRPRTPQPPPAIDTHSQPPFGSSMAPFFSPSFAADQLWQADFPGDPSPSFSTAAGGGPSAPPPPPPHFPGFPEPTHLDPALGSPSFSTAAGGGAPAPPPPPPHFPGFAEPTHLDPAAPQTSPSPAGDRA